MTGQTISASAGLLRALAADTFRTHTFNGEWTLECQADEQAKSDHDLALLMADELEAMPATAARLDPHHAKVRLMLANLAGAVSALAVAINNAGGYRVFDPDRSEPIHRAMAALTNAFDEAMALPPVTANENENGD